MLRDTTSFLSATGAFKNYEQLSSKLPVLKEALTGVARKAVLYLTRFLAFLEDPVNNFLYRKYPVIKNIQGYRSSGTPSSVPMLSTAFTTEIGSPTLPLQYEQQTEGTESEGTGSEGTESEGTESEGTGAQDV
jgi:hypothetical protein